MGLQLLLRGKRCYRRLNPHMEDWSGRAFIAKRLEQLLGIRSVKVVAGDSESEPTAKSLLGLEAAKQFTIEIGDGKTIAVTGGSSIASIPKQIEKSAVPNDLLFIAARGGVGEEIGLQANVIAASFAEACGGTYSTFYYPESLSEEAHEAFRKDLPL